MRAWISACGRMAAFFVLEANCNPNLSHGEDFAEAAEKGGIAYDTLLERIIRLGLGYEAEWRV